MPETERPGGATLWQSDQGRRRRMSKDYERLTETSEAFIYVAIRRLTRS